ncbi:MAG: AAA family ATPase [Thermodesulfobacteriota bacterium]
MKILKLRFKNLNSLEGEWTIDFEESSYQAEGIFAITGPTGSGKSTVLDAVTLALYAQTPRLGKITSSFNEIMSRTKGECFSEVTFLSSEGIFTAFFAQHRSRKKAGEKLQPPKHEIFNEKGEIVETGLSKVPFTVKEKTGLDFERFTRSALLAQGGFAAFLDATPGERAPILEEITGTEIYSEISVKVHEKKRSESQLLENLNNQIKGIEIFDDQQKKVFYEELESLNKEHESVLQIFDDIIKSINHIDNLKKINTEIEERKKELESLNALKEVLKPEKEKLELAEKAAELDRFYDNLNLKRKTYNKYLKDLEVFKKDLLFYEKEYESSKKDSDEKKIVLENLKKDKNQKLAILNEARKKDTILKEIQKDLNSIEERIKKSEHDLSKEIKAKNQNETDLKQKQNELKKTEEYLKANKNHEKLINNYYKITSYLESLKKDTQTATSKDREISELKSSLGEFEKQLNKKSQEFEKIKKDYESENKKLTSLNEKLYNLLEGKTPEQLNSYLEKIKNDYESAKKSFELIGAEKELLKKRDELKDKLKNAEKTRTEIIQKLEFEKINLLNYDKTIELLEKQVILLSKIESLEKERKKLEHNKPCPLCGSTKHPYSQQGVPEKSDEEKKLNTEKDKRKKLAVFLDELNASKITTDSEIKNLKIRISEIESEAENKKALYFELLEKLKIDFENIEKGLAEKTDLLEKISLDYKKKIKNIYETENYIKLSRQELDKISLKYSETEKQQIDLNNKITNTKNEIKRISDEKQNLDLQIKDTKNSIYKELQGIDVSGPDEKNPDEIISMLKKRYDLWNEKKEAEIEIKNEIQKISSKIDLNNQAKETKLNELGENKKLFEKRNSDFEKLVYERKEIFGDKDPDTEEKNIENSILKSETDFNKSFEKHNQASKMYYLSKEKIKDIHTNISELEKEINELESEFVKQLKNKGFDSEKNYLEAYLTLEERKNLKNKIDENNKNIENVKSVLANLEITLEKEKQNHKSEKDYKDLLKEKEEYNNKLAFINEKKGEINSALNRNKENQIKFKEKIEEIKNQEKECLKWNNLHELIGSSDGKKFRNFAQGLTFEVMVNLANRQLQEMTDRYLLTRDLTNPLELNVIDNYQGGEIRSSKNLSGGESFVVSLCLALGLSNMAGKNIKVDSLFLDEGFGTLDDESLETALESLGKLNSKGKVIGVISHVQALKDSVPLQLNIEPASGGRSMISGPGCSFIGN